MAVLVTAASKHGATTEIAQAIGAALTERGIPVVEMAPQEVRDVGEYEAVVLGSAVYTGHWLRPALALVDRCSDGWAGRPVWLFSSGPVGDPTRSLARKMGVDPVDLPTVRDTTHARDHRMFPGRIDRANLPFAQRMGLALFRSLNGDFRDWDAVAAWSSGIADALRPTAAP